MGLFAKPLVDRMLRRRGKPVNDADSFVWHDLFGKRVLEFPDHAPF